MLSPFGSTISRPEVDDKIEGNMNVYQYEPVESKSSATYPSEMLTDKESTNDLRLHNNDGFRLY